jgi:hypothetical protein
MVIAPESFPTMPQPSSTGVFVFPAQKTILAPTLQDFIIENQRLQALVRKKGVTAGFELSVTRSDNLEQQSISIKNWVLTGSGVVQASAAGGWTVAVSIVHPAYRSTEGIGWLPNATDAQNAPGTAKGGNPVDLFIEALEDYYRQTEAVINDPGDSFFSEGTSVTDFDCASSITTVAEKSRERLKSAIDALKASVVWNNGGGADLPFPKEALASSDYLLRMMWAELSGQRSVWEQFVAQMSALELTVWGGPTDDKLQVRPFAPWGKATLVLYDRELWSLDISPYDNRDIGGVVAYFSGGLDADSLSAYVPVNGAVDVRLLPQFTGLAGYVCPLMAKKPLSGPVEAVNPPAWIRDYLYDLGSGYDLSNHPLGFDKYDWGAEELSSGQEQPQMPEGLVLATEADFRKYVTAVKKYCRQFFLRNFRSGAGISMGIRLLLQKEGGQYVTPGLVARIDSVTENPSGASATPVLYFYITRVVHNIDVMANEANTNLVGAFVRSPEDVGLGGLTAGHLENGMVNQIYATGKTG